MVEAVSEVVVMDVVSLGVVPYDVVTDLAGVVEPG